MFPWLIPLAIYIFKKCTFSWYSISPPAPHFLGICLLLFIILWIINVNPPSPFTEELGQSAAAKSGLIFIILLCRHTPHRILCWQPSYFIRNLLVWSPANVDCFYFISFTFSQSLWLGHRQFILTILDPDPSWLGIIYLFLDKPFISVTFIFKEIGLLLDVRGGYLLRFNLTKNNDNNDNNSYSRPGTWSVSSLIRPAFWHGKYYLCFADTFYLYSHHVPGRFTEAL